MHAMVTQSPTNQYAHREEVTVAIHHLCVQVIFDFKIIYLFITASGSRMNEKKNMHWVH